jgi:hypothetical protein
MEYIVFRPQTPARDPSHNFLIRPVIKPKHGDRKYLLPRVFHTEEPHLERGYKISPI